MIKKLRKKAEKMKEISPFQLFFNISYGWSNSIINEPINISVVPINSNFNNLLPSMKPIKTVITGRKPFIKTPPWYAGE